MLMDKQELSLTLIVLCRGGGKEPHDANISEKSACELTALIKNIPV